MPIGAKEWTQQVVSARAAVDLAMGTIVKFDANGDLVPCAAVTDIPAGVVRDSVKAGDSAALVISGITSVKASAAIGIGVFVGTTAAGLGKVIVAGTDTTQYIVGQATEAATAANDLIAVRLILAGRAA